ncbi:hypothetical protein GCM10009736_10280 [Actinomadura bangladeshensis]
MDIVGVGVDLPEPVDVRELAAGRDAPVEGYCGWTSACHAGPDDHPSTMGTRALDRALAYGLVAADLRLVVYCGAARDYQPSWSVSTEIMRLTEATEACLGIDTTAATLTGLDLVHGRLALHGGGHAALVAVERWTHTIDHGDPASSALWSDGDGAAAAVVALEAGAPGRLRFVAAEFRSRSEFNGYVRIEYGGTRAPLAPAGEDPHRRRVVGRSWDDVIAAYRDGYAAGYATLRARFPTEPTHLLCSQISPGVVGIIGVGARPVGPDDRHRPRHRSPRRSRRPCRPAPLPRRGPPRPGCRDGRERVACLRHGPAGLRRPLGVPAPHDPRPTGSAGSTEGVTP